MIAELLPPPVTAPPARPAPAARPGIDVSVTSVPAGGWEIVATRDGREVGRQHCDDWHRVERVRGQFARRSWVLPEIPPDIPR